MKYTFKELIDVPKLQKLTDELYAIASIPSAIIAMDGEILTGSGWQKICTDFHRKNPQIEKECIESDININRKLESGESFVIYKCPRGLVDASSPIIIDGEHVANVFSGQIFLEPPDETTVQFFREQAWKFGFDEVEYIEALREVPIFTEKKFQSGISFLVKFSQSIAEMGLTQLRNLESLETLRENKERLRIQNQIANIFLTKSDEGMYGEILSVVLGTMESKFGVFGYIDEQGDLVCPSMTKDIWDQCQISDKTIVFPEDTWGESIWGNGLRTGLSAYSNKPSKVPEGHIPVARSLAVPILYQQKSIGLFVVANKTTDYTESDKQHLQEIAEQVAPVLNARIEKERSNKALQESEEKLARAKKMEAMGLMAGGVAHDLNNILSGIVSYPELLLLDLPEDSPLRRPIKTIQESGMRAADVVEDLLTIARGVATGNEVLNFNTMVKEYLNSAEHQKLEKVHPMKTFKTELDSELLNITGSASHVKTILMNLIANASEAIDEGKGTVTVSTVQRQLHLPTDDNYTYPFFLTRKFSLIS